MDRRYRIVIIMIVVALLIAVTSGCAKNDAGNYDRDTAGSQGSAVIVSFDNEKQSGYASNQFVVWIEDLNGTLIQTLYATKYTAKGGYKNRPDSIPLWVEKSDLASMSAVAVDAIS